MRLQGAWMHHGTYAADKQTWLIPACQGALFDGAAIPPSVIPVRLSIDEKRAVITELSQ